MVEKIDLNTVIKKYQVEDINTFQNYLAEIWGDLARRGKEPSKGIKKLTFTQYYELPGIISDRLYAVFDRNNNNFLDPVEFIGGMKTLFTENFQQLAKFIFKFYDFDNDNLITKEDVRVVLSYVPLNIDFNNNSKKMKYEKNNFKENIESQKELCDILSTSFGTKETLNYDEYIDVIENKSSDIFLFILIFLLEKRPFNSETVKVYKKDKKLLEDQDYSKTPVLMSHKIASPSLGSRFLFPSLKKISKNILNNPKNILDLYSGKGKIGFVREEPSNKKIFGDKKSAKVENKEKMKPHRRIRQKLDDLQDKTPVISNFTYSKNDGEKTDDSIIYEDEDENEKNTLIKHEGYMYKISHSKKLKKVYFKLIGRDFYYFKNKEDTSHKGMHNLSGIYIKPGDKVIIEGKSFFTFSILYPQKARTYYIEDENEYKEWLNKLHLSIDYKNLLDLYEIKEKTGKGKFGLVKHAIHKETGKEVAIKIMSKKLNNDLELTKTEIDILKICHHPNIIKLYDIFDTADYIYIIMEYCAGGDLFSYIEKRNYKLPEPRAAQIIHKLSMAIFYIHSYGIIHRDLKPENILMTDESDNADIRLLDFGLSKIIGPNEKCTEPFGTLSFVAPEVLKGKPYDKSVDLWSIGIIAYLLMCGFLPFDDEHSEREIARQTIQDPVPYPSNIWKNLSPEAKEFVGSLLKKNPEDRIGIKEVLNSKWIRKYVEVPAERDIMNENDNTNHKSHFEAFSTDKNMK
jgi:tRNA A-37 threonylcarbamoyl transferase component Bud32/Ca2+-binding EF-hand superfamily protein